jgi:hypothetical protein
MIRSLATHVHQQRPLYTLTSNFPVASDKRHDEHCQGDTLRRKRRTAMYHRSIRYPRDSDGDPRPTRRDRWAPSIESQASAKNRFEQRRRCKGSGSDKQSVVKHCQALDEQPASFHRSDALPNVTSRRSAAPLCKSPLSFKRHNAIIPGKTGLRVICLSFISSFLFLPPCRRRADRFH